PVSISLAFSLFSSPAPAPPATYPLSLHDALPISHHPADEKTLVGRLLGPAEPEVTCEACFDALDEYVELSLAGADTRTALPGMEDRKSTRLNSSHVEISYAVFCLKKKKKQ